jgi:hypothetical protein
MPIGLCWRSRKDTQTWICRGQFDKANSFKTAEVVKLLKLDIQLMDFANKVGRFFGHYLLPHYAGLFF